MKDVFEKRKHDEDSVLRRETVRHRWDLQLPKWAVSQVEVDKRAGVKQKRKFPLIVIVWLVVCSKRVSSIVIS